VVLHLVTGNPGSGKTALAEELARRGVPAIDGDSLAGWESVDGGPVTTPEQRTDDWLRRHRWVWSRDRVQQLAAAHAGRDAPAFVCGIAMNLRSMLDLFDTVFLLSIDDATQVRRLDSSGNRNAAERAQVVTGRPFFEAELRAAGARVLDGTRPTAQLADQLLHVVRQR
jgi:broad-specificity NMP kinase